MVSQNRRRFLDFDGDFDLDLTYVCDRLIAMSLPCVGGAFYRNDIRDVSKFFAQYHYGSFTVYNCCEAHEESGNGKTVGAVTHRISVLPKTTNMATL